MSDSPRSPDTLRFTDPELDTLARTADAMSAWIGKPVLAQVVDAAETGYEWVVFAIPLLPHQDTSDITVVQVGGPDTRIIGSQGGLNLAENELYDCEYLWAIQLSDLQGVRYIKIDDTGEEVAWTNDLTEIIPFDVNQTWLNSDTAADDDEVGGSGDDGIDYGDDDDVNFGATPHYKGPGPTIH